jgi:hypothetical protein
MRKPSAELENPTAWLESLEADPAGYQKLILESAGVVRASYRLAQARCRAGNRPSTPTLADLRSAAATIAKRAGVAAPLPISSMMPDESGPHPTVPDSVMRSISMSPAARSVPPPAPVRAGRR